MCRRRRGGCRMPDWLRDYEARTCSILAIISFSCAVTSFAVFTDSAVLSLTMPLKRAVCTVMSAEELYGLTKCHWTSCRGSCTAMFYNCTQIKVVYVLSENQTSNVSDPDVFSAGDNVMISNVSHVKHREIRIPAEIQNETQNKIVFEDKDNNTKYNAKSREELKNSTPNKTQNNIVLQDKDNNTKNHAESREELKTFTQNKTQNNIVLQDRDNNTKYNAESLEKLKNFTQYNVSNTFEPHLEINTTINDKSGNILNLENSIFRILLPSNNDNVNKTSKPFALNNLNETVPVSIVDKSIDTTDFESGHFNSDYIKEYDAADLVNLNATNPENTSSIVPLYVNIFGCGYEPEELCEQFFANYTHVGMEFQCLISHESEIFAVPDPEDYDFTKFKDPMRSLLLSLIPSGICVLSASYIRVRRLYKMKPKTEEDPEPKGRRRLMVKRYPAEEKESKSPTHVESRSSTKMGTHKNGQEQPAFIKVQVPLPPPVTDPSQNIDREQFL